MRYLRVEGAFAVDPRWFAHKAARGFATVVVLLLVLHDAAFARMQLSLRESTLPPVAHTLFCISYPSECSEAAASASFLASPVQALYRSLDLVNRNVNAAIRPLHAKEGNIATDRWLLSPLSGNCNDYAVSKRHELLRLGWPSWALLLAEVVVATGEHHLVLVANAGGESFVLDNLKQGVVPLAAAADYRWIRIESPDDPKFWIAFDSKESLPAR
jgi:predicted transglutaminase-like cysteine proteinase